MGKIFQREYFFRLILVIGSTLLALVICEFGLRAVYALKDKDGKYYVYPPNLHKIQKIKAGNISGVGETANFRTSSVGIRGDEFSIDDQYRILAIGGSTTACLYLDQEKAWPLLLQKDLNAVTESKIWVGNVGKAGLSSREHYMHMMYLLPQYPRIDAVIILVGCNDLFRRLIEDNNYDPYFLDHYETWKRKLIAGAFSETPYYKGKFRFKTGYYDQSAIGNLYVRIRQMYTRRTLIQDEKGNYVELLRDNRKNAREIVGKLPDLGPALAEYEKNLNAVIDIARAKSVRIIFATQPSLLRRDMPRNEQNLINAGWIGSEKSGRYYSSDALAEGLSQYNEALKRVCRVRGVECIDLAGALPRSTKVFYDEVHFNDNGSLLTAKAVFDYLRQAPPFSPAR